MPQPRRTAPPQPNRPPPHAHRAPHGLAQRLLCTVLAGTLGLCGALAPAMLQAQADPLRAATQPDPLRLPSLGESASDEFNLGAEKRLGEQIMREIRRDPDYLDDPQLLDYLQSVWQPLVQAARARGDIGPDSEPLFPYEPFLVRDRSVNAFALPGGFVGVHLALIAITASRDELASVLAHELSHITQRHIARGIVASQRSSTLGLAATILAMLAASRAASVDLAQAAIVGGQAAMVQSQLNFSRDMEREADRNGIALMSGAGFAPAGMAAMFEKLDQANRLNDNSSYPYLRSHPLTTERIGEARQRINNLPHPATAAAPGDDGQALHSLMRARARVLMDGGASALRRLQDSGLQALSASASLAATVPAASAAMAAPPATTGTMAEREAALYAGALASVQLRDLATAQRLAQALMAPMAAATPPPSEVQRGIRRLAAEVALASGRASDAAPLLAALPRDGSRAGLLLRAAWAQADGTPSVLRDSADALQIWLSAHRGDAGAWLALAQHAQQQGQPLRAVRAEAEAKAALGDLRGAIDRMRAGQQMVQRGGAGMDFIEASVIDARLRDLQAQRRDLQRAGELE